MTDQSAPLPSAPSAEALRLEAESFLHPLATPAPEVRAFAERVRAILSAPRDNAAPQAPIPLGIDSPASAVGTSQPAVAAPVPASEGKTDRLHDPREDKSPPTKERCPHIVQMMWDLGMYTQAREVQRLADAYHTPSRQSGATEGNRLLAPIADGRKDG